MIQKAYLDVNVVMVLLQRREPWFADSLEILELVKLGKLRGATSALTFRIAVYLLRSNPPEALLKIFGLLEVVPLDRNLPEAALGSFCRDFEDALHAATARTVGANIILTRDLRFEAPGGPPTVTPAAFLAHLSPAAGPR